MASFFKNNFYLFFFGIFAFVGSCLGIAGAWFYLDRNALINDGVQTVGVVTELVRSSGSNTQAPVVEFNLVLQPAGIYRGRVCGTLVQPEKSG